MLTAPLHEGGLDALSSGDAVALLVPVPAFSLGHMTLAIGVYARDGIALVADGRISRPQLGSLVVDTDDAQKLYGFGRFGVAAAGFSALTDDVVRELRTEGVLDACDGVTAARTNAETLLRRFMQRFAEIPPALWPVGALLVAGYEADRMTPRIYSLHSKAAFQGGPFNWVGDERGGIAADALSRLLLEGRERRSLDEAKLFGIMAVQAAHHVDPSVGPPRSMAIVTPGHGYQDLGHEVPEFVARSRSAENRLREAFSAALTSARP